jgi:hypothetical protein
VNKDEAENGPAADTMPSGQLVGPDSPLQDWARDIRATITVTPYPASMPDTCASSGRVKRSGWGAPIPANAVTARAPAVISQSTTAGGMARPAVPAGTPGCVDTSR